MTATLIAKFAENFIPPIESGFGAYVAEETEYKRGIHIPAVLADLDEMSEEKVPIAIKSATPEQLAEELVAFAKKEFPEESMMFLGGRITQLFWKSKGIDQWNVPPDIELKIEKAQMMAQKQLSAERVAKAGQQLEKEKSELPSLVNSCVQWARKLGLKTLTQANVEAFLLEQNMTISPQTRRSLYAIANTQLRPKG